MESFYRYERENVLFVEEFVLDRYTNGIVGKSDPFRVTGVMHVTLSLSFNFFLSIFSEVHAVESSGLFIR